MPSPCLANTGPMHDPYPPLFPAISDHCNTVISGLMLGRFIHQLQPCKEDRKPAPYIQAGTQIEDQWHGKFLVIGMSGKWCLRVIMVIQSF